MNFELVMPMKELHKYRNQYSSFAKKSFSRRWVYDLCNNIVATGHIIQNIFAIPPTSVL